MSQPIERPTSRLNELDASTRRRLIATSALRAAGFVAIAIAAYYVAPWTGGAVGSVAARVGVAMALVVAAIFASLLAVRRAAQPILRSIELLAAVVSLSIVGFASTYLVISTQDVDAFSEPLGHTGALYFTMTTATTVGFGDIAARSEAARIVVMINMVANIALLGGGVRIVFGTARRRASAP